MRSASVKMRSRFFRRRRTCRRSRRAARRRGRGRVRRPRPPRTGSCRCRNHPRRGRGRPGHARRPRSAASHRAPGHGGGRATPARAVAPVVCRAGRDPPSRRPDGSGARAAPARRRTAAAWRPAADERGSARSLRTRRGAARHVRRAGSWVATRSGTARPPGRGRSRGRVPVRRRHERKSRWSPPVPSATAHASTAPERSRGASRTSGSRWSHQCGSYGRGSVNSTDTSSTASARINGADLSAAATRRSRSHGVLASRSSSAIGSCPAVLSGAKWSASCPKRRAARPRHRRDRLPPGVRADRR